MQAPAGRLCLAVTSASTRMGPLGCSSFDKQGLAVKRVNSNETTPTKSPNLKTDEAALKGAMKRFCCMTDFKWRILNSAETRHSVLNASVAPAGADFVAVE